MPSFSYVDNRIKYKISSNAKNFSLIPSLLTFLKKYMNGCGNLLNVILPPCNDHHFSPLTWYVATSITRFSNVTLSLTS